jgi:hypothetical protein
LAVAGSSRKPGGGGTRRGILREEGRIVVGLSRRLGRGGFRRGDPGGREENRGGAIEKAWKGKAVASLSRWQE